MSWQDNLMEEEMPPEWMWHLDEELVEFLDDVQAARRERYGMGSDDRSTGSMERNEYARGRGRHS